MKLCSGRRFFHQLCLLCLLCASVVSCFALDREAFSVTKYDLEIRVEPDQQRLGARGTIALRNDSTTAQKIAVLQISSSLSWRSIRVADKQVQFVAQPYTSDIDHTGALSEAIITLPEALAPGKTVELQIAYEGVIVLDATRLVQIGTPENTARSNDFDQISPKFTVLRGVGYVAWYPIATEAADLASGLAAGPSDSASLAEILERWKKRETAAAARFRFTVSGEEDSELVVNAASCSSSSVVEHQLIADCSYSSMASVLPTVVLANYERLDRAGGTIHFLRGHDTGAATYGSAMDKAAPVIAEWFGVSRNRAQTVDLPDLDSPPFETGSFLLTPLASLDPKAAGLAAAHQLTHAAFWSPRLWINEGLAHFAQALYMEHDRGRQAALDYMATHRSAMGAAEIITNAPRSEDEVKRALVNTANEALVRSKAMCVWWMLRDIVGDAALKKAIANYKPEQDQSPSYMQTLIQAQTKKDIGWFFDDWVYNDRGLPDFRVKSVYAIKGSGAYLVTITVENQGAAGAEIPVTVKFAGGEITNRITVRGKSGTTIHVSTNETPEEVVVNDGSVPESNTKNNVYKIQESEIRTPASSQQ